LLKVIRLGHACQTLTLQLIQTCVVKQYFWF
jgi:hypothetical protein